MPGVTVKLLTLVTDPDGKRASSFRYYQPALSPSRVIEHETPTTLYQFSYGNWAGRPIRTTKIRSSTENVSLTWANGRLASVCELDSAGNCDVSKAQETTVPPTGVSDSTCTRESAGNFTRIERDSLGRKLAEYPGLKSCAAPSAAEALIGKKFGYLGSTAKPAFESVPSVDATAPAGFVATTAWDYTQPAGAIDPHCGSAACWTSSAYNAAPLNDRTQREVTWGRTLVDENGSWGTQVQVTTWGYSALGQLTTIDGPRRDVSDLTTRTYYAAGGSPGPASLQQIQRSGRIVFQASDYDLLGNARTTTDENGLTTTKTFEQRRAFHQLRAAKHRPLPDGGVGGARAVSLGPLPDARRVHGRRRRREHRQEVRKALQEAQGRSHQQHGRALIRWCALVLAARRRRALERVRSQRGRTMQLG